MSPYFYIAVAVAVALISVVAMGLFGGGNHMPVDGKVSSSPKQYHVQTTECALTFVFVYRLSW